MLVGNSGQANLRSGIEHVAQELEAGSHMMKEDDQFQVWLMDMDDAIERFRRSLPASVSARLDFSPESLNVLEGVALEKYSDVGQITKRSEAIPADGMARYVGEVFRKHFGGKWMIDYSDPKKAFHGLPQLSGMAGQRTPACPLTLVTASTHHYIKTIFDNYQKRAASDAGGMGGT